MKVEICPTCNGIGETSYWESGHNPDEIIETCSKCNGTGRIMIDEYHITVPFGTDLRKGYYEVNKKIIELIREYEKNK